MNTIWKIAAAVGVGAAATALVALPAGAVPARHHPHPARAGGVVFAQNDAIGGNAVLAYRRTATGGLKAAGRYLTGGTGGVLGGSVVDHLAAQGSLAYDHGALYAVNAGSDTITAFRVHGDRLARRQTIGSGGTFPVSVAARGRLVFVLNARAGGSISGYLRVGDRLVAVPAWHRELNLATSAPGNSAEFTSTPAQVGFTPNGRALVVTTKNGGNSVAVFPFSRSGPARTPVVTSLPGTVPFGCTFDARGRFVVTEAGPNAVATFTLGRDGRLAAVSSAATGQAATCWIVAAGRTVYASNAGSGTLSAYRVGRTLTALGMTATGAGTVDSAVSADGRYLYVQTGATGGLDAFRIGRDGTLRPTGSVTVPDGVGGEGLVAL